MLPSIGQKRIVKIKLEILERLISPEHANLHRRLDIGMCIRHEYDGSSAALEFE